MKAVFDLSLAHGGVSRAGELGGAVELRRRRLRWTGGRATRLRRLAPSTALITAMIRSLRGEGTRASDEANASNRSHENSSKISMATRIARPLDRQHVTVDARVELEGTRTRCGRPIFRRSTLAAGR